MISHTGTEIRPRLLREAAVGNIAQGESLTQQRRVIDDALRSVKICPKGRIVPSLIGLVHDGTLEESAG